MRKLFYEEEDRRQFWENLWQHVGCDPDAVDTSTYPFYPAINYIKEKDGLVLECGCGPGRVAKYFYNNGFNVIGMDFSSVAVKNLKKSKPDIKVVCANALHLPFLDKSFKYICAFGVYGSFKESHQRKQMLSEVNRVLRQDGILILSVGSNNILYCLFLTLIQNNFIRRIFNKKPLRRYFGWYQFRKKEIKKELNEAGFNPTHFIYAKTNQFFYNLFPFFRINDKGFDRRDALKLERGGENIYPLNKAGKAVFSYINKKFPQLIAMVIVTVSNKKVNSI